MTLEKDEPACRAQWKKNIADLMDAYSQSLPKAAREFVDDRLAEPLIDPDVRAGSLQERSCILKIVAISSGSICLALFVAALLAWPLNGLAATSIFTYAAPLAFAVVFAVAYFEFRRTRFRAKMWQHLVEAGVAKQLLDIVNCSLEARKYIANVMNLYSWYRFGDYLVAERIAAAAAKNKYAQIDKVDHKSALWELFEITEP